MTKSRLMEPALRANLATCADAYLAAVNVTSSTLAKYMGVGSDFLDEVRRGVGFRVATYDKAMIWFSTNWPKGVRWPKGVPRPARGETSAPTGVTREAADGVG